MKTKVMLISALCLFIMGATYAQEKGNRFGIELNGDVSFVSNELAGASLNTGLGFEGILQYRFMPYTSVYGGWGYSHFSAKESFAGPNVDFEQTGYILGLQVLYPHPNTPVSYFVRGGMLYSHIETENSSGDIISDTGHGIGFQVAGGIEFALGRNWSIAPGVKFNYLSAETGIEGINYQLEHRYVSARVGIIKRF